jgi:hypothetical protein
VRSSILLFDAQNGIETRFGSYALTWRATPQPPHKFTYRLHTYSPFRVICMENSTKRPNAGFSAVFMPKC